MEIRSRVGNVTQQTETEMGAPDAAAPSAAPDRSAGVRALLVLALFVLAFQWVEGINGDTSWLLTVADRWFDGAKPYVDILESNPPAAVLMLMPSVALARLIGCPPEPLVAVMTVGLALAAIELALRVLLRSTAVANPSQTRLVLGFALLVLPMSIFAEREHFAIIGLVPLWALMVQRAEAAVPQRWAVVVAGVGGCLALSLKPQFALMILLPALVVARSRRSFAALFLPEYWIVAAGAVAYAAIVVTLFPAYGASMVPLVFDLYQPVREPVIAVLAVPQLGWTALAVVGLWALGGRERRPAIAISLAAAFGGVAFAVVQAKGFAYHYYPAVAAAVPALADQGLTLANRRFSVTTDRSGRPLAAFGFIAVAVGLAFATLSFLGFSKPMTGLMAPIRNISLHPRILSISPHIWVGHPLTRDVDGSWVGSVPNQWMTIGALYKLGLHPDEPEARRLSALIDADRARAANDIARGKPDIVLVERDDLVLPAWFNSFDELAAFLSGYRRRFDYLGVELWARDDLGEVLPAASGH
ncbi:MAG: hypothetical protein P4L82_16820 [Ancalomicrobiaceae bacterium]|nr:hypothetical protein [Ancalomicrobiaceae bacterium]